MQISFEMFAFGWRQFGGKILEKNEFFDTSKFCTEHIFSDSSLTEPEDS